ncbi:Rpn family recombination-promoting nuclease/putative transposase [Ancylothrix sp. C2]|uniref:Rpn family recombination-promoting nuclease/putative transposase n=1 Tax=Ancylothrix sp. D3o TaxID=2953691 RepID=UPI0021BB6A59|nr:Rpn family recombination-promoting nuclease/putative transposase [Ancylothrix sp. D3o]MCT7950176.1 Rpn family recombination-promoting nuclease/putative transposase [Ancylothrix sp. D3o]
MRFISPKTDFAFKKIFASEDSKDILISFLNALLYEGEPTIEDLEIIDPYSAGRNIGLKDSYLDVKARLQDETIVIIEMQVLNVEAFDKRVLYNAAKTYATQLKSGEGYFKLKPVIALTITDFIMFEETDEICSRFVFKEKQKLFDYKDNHLELVFVELPKFTKTLEELETLADKWIFFIKTAPSLETVPDKMAEVPALEKALRIANEVNLSREEMEELEKRVMFLEDQKGVLRLGLREGREQGLREGQTTLILRLLNRRLGEVPADIQDQINSLTLEKLNSLGETILELTNFSQLSEWLQANSSTT